MIIPDKCLFWLNLQRSGYKRKRIEFIDNMDKEYRLMRPFLPARCDRLLDIGCGIGGIDVEISKHYDNDPVMYLMDNSFVSPKIKYGFDRGASYYNSFGATDELMRINGVENYNLVDVKNGFPKIKEIDLIISLLSWGYHYPVDAYIDEVVNRISKDGVLIMDIRENTDGVSKVSKHFSNVRTISIYNKSIRIAAKGVIKK